MAIFNSYVSLPEGIIIMLQCDPSDTEFRPLICHEQMHHLAPTVSFGVFNRGKGYLHLTARLPMVTSHLLITSMAHT